MIASEDQELVSIMERKVAAEIRRVAKQSSAASIHTPKPIEFAAPRVYTKDTYHVSMCMYVYTYLC